MKDGLRPGVKQFKTLPLTASVPAGTCAMSLRSAVEVVRDCHTPAWVDPSGFTIFAASPALPRTTGRRKVYNHIVVVCMETFPVSFHVDFVASNGKSSVQIFTPGQSANRGSARFRAGGNSAPGVEARVRTGPFRRANTEFISFRPDVLRPRSSYLIHSLPRILSPFLRISPTTFPPATSVPLRVPNRTTALPLHFSALPSV